MTKAMDAVQTQQLLDTRASSLTHRILAGAGSVSIVAYRTDSQPELRSVAHGLASDGTLVVAANVTAEGVDDVFRTDERLEVRADFMKLANEFDVRIVSATTHLLGELEWLAPAEAEVAFSDVLLPAALTELAASPGGRIGVIHAERAVTHTSNGVTALPFAELVAHHRTCDVLFAQRIDAIATELVLAASSERLDMFASALAEGWFGGLVLSRRETASGCEPVHGRTFVVDVDQSGLTLMQVRCQETAVLFAPFETRALTERQLRATLSALLDLEIT